MVQDFDCQEAHSFRIGAFNSIAQTLKILETLFLPNAGKLAETI
jgi:hypothetical protein